jgi:hypothetical protein
MCDKVLIVTGSLIPPDESHRGALFESHRNLRRQHGGLRRLLHGVRTMAGRRLRRDVRRVLGRVGAEASAS